MFTVASHQYVQMLQSFLNPKRTELENPDVSFQQVGLTLWEYQWQFWDDSSHNTWSIFYSDIQWPACSLGIPP